MNAPNTAQDDAEARPGPKQVSTDVQTAPARPAQSEAQFQRQVITLAEVCGWWVYHPYDSRRSRAGFPDLVLVHAGRRRLLFRELKTDRGRVTVEQILVLAALRQCGADVGVWRPKEWASIEATLTGRTA